jgi:hypothetical protein
MSVKYIFEHFVENDKPDFEKFAALTTEELDYLATVVNWDFDMPTIQWIVNQPICSKATALRIFWMAQPEDYLHYDLKSDKGDVEPFELIKNIMDKYQHNFYLEADIHYNPKEDMPAPDFTPSFMKAPTCGEESYVYYEKKDIPYGYWNGLQSALGRISDRMELFNIAYFIDSLAKPKDVKMILEHPLCDKAIAILVYWRLKTNLMVYTATDEILSAIVESIKENKYPEMIAYNPMQDDKIKILNRKMKWSIPDVMKQPV